MFIVLLRFSENKNQAGQHMDGHKAWIKQGLDEGVFLVVGSLQPNAGGAILAHGESLPKLQKRVGEDPFVSEHIVSAEILEITPGQVDARLSFLMT